MDEACVTITLMENLEQSGFEIVSFDFPQSGTGKILHPNNSTSKNFKAIIPDIIAVKNDICLVFEDKDHFYLGDFEKCWIHKTINPYSNDLNKLVSDYGISYFYFGIGLYEQAFSDRHSKYLYMVDFVLLIDDSKNTFIRYKKKSLENKL